MNNNKSILAGIVLYNPNPSRLEQNVNAIKKSIDSIVFFDNASKNESDIQNFAEIHSIKIIKSNVNMGLPHAFNTMIDYAITNGYENLLLLDQDSICGKDFIKLYKDNISSNYTCLVPRIIHRLKEYENKYGLKDFKTSTKPVLDSINSGTMINLAILPKEIRFNEKLFIDCVDFDFFIQLKKRDLKVLRINNAELLCDLGNLKVHTLLHKKVFSNNYSVFRLEKQAKDRVLFILANFKEPIARKVLKLSLLGYLMIVLFEKQKISKLFAVSKGFVKGLIALFH